MNTKIATSLRRSTAVFASLAMLLATSSGAVAETVQEKRAEAEQTIPKCAQVIGTAAIMEPENQWWREYTDLGSPEALIRLYVRESGCFTLVNRGRGMSQAMAERDLASSGELRNRSNIGKGQIVAADYIIVPDLVTQNRNSGGNKVGGLLGGFVGGIAGAVLGGIDLKKKSASVILYVTDTRSSVEVAAAEGQAKKTDLGWGAGGGGFFGGGLFAAAGASGYQNSEIGQVIALAYLDAYKKMVSQLGGLGNNASANNVEQAVEMKRAGRMYAKADPKSAVVRDVEVGMMLYPTGSKEGALWEVEDELGNRGWVSSVLFGLAR